jgi:hypothetical protein
MRNNKPANDQQAAARLLQAFDKQPEMNCEDIQGLIPGLIEAESAGNDVHANPEFAALLKHLDECSTCSELYESVVGDLDATLGEADVLPEVGPYPGTFFTPRPLDTPAKPKSGKPTLDQISQYFLTDPTREENRAAVREIARQVLRKVDPEYPPASTLMINRLLDKAAQGQPVGAGTRAPFSLANFDLLIQIVVPLAVNLLSEALWTSGTSTVQALKAGQAALSSVTEAQVQDLLHKAQVKANNQDITRLTKEVNDAFQTLLRENDQA